MTDKEVKETCLIFHRWLLEDEQVDLQKEGTDLAEMFDIFWNEYNSN